MKQIRQAVIDALDSGVPDLVRCTRIERRDGAVFRYTEYDRQLMMGNGTMYVPNPAILPTTAVTYDSDGQGASVDLEGALDANDLRRDEFVGGIWDFAKVYQFRTLASDPVEDDVADFMGKLGEVEIGQLGLTVRMIGLAKQLDQTVGVKTSVTCRAQLGDSACGVRLDPPTWTAETEVTAREEEDAKTGDVVKPTTENGRHFKCVTGGTTGASEPAWNTTLGATTTDGTAEWEAIQALTQTDTVQSVTGPGEFTGALGFPDDWFGAGTVRFTSGVNAGIEREVQTYVSDVYTLWVAMPFPVEVGDTFTVTAGCRKRFEAECIDKFDNNLNFRGEPFSAGPSVTGKFGGQNGA